MADKNDWGEAQSVSGNSTGGAPKYRCSVCKTPVRDDNHAARHAKQSGHVEFEEYIPQPGEDVPVIVDQPKYTDEERQAQVEKLQATIKAKKEQKKEVEEQSSLAKTLELREAAKQAQETRETLIEAKRLRDIEKQKREKQLEQEHAERVRAKLAQAQREREAAQSGQPIKTEEPKPVNSVPIPAAKQAADYTEVTLQIRQGSTGKPLIAKFKPTDTIETVAIYLVSNRTDGQRGAFVLSTPNPKREFTPDLMKTTLLEAQLVPRGVLMMIPK